MPKILNWISLGWMTLFILFCLIIPLGAVLSHGPLEVDPVLAQVAMVTGGQALASTLFTAMISLPLGLWLWPLLVEKSKLGRLSRIFLSFPFGVPTLVTAFVGIAWIGRSWLYSLKAVLLVHVFLNVPWLTLIVAQARAQLPEEPLQSARTLGASAFQRFRWLLWPAIRLPWMTGLVQVLSFCLMSFVLVLLLGGGPPVETLETFIYSKVRYSVLDISAATTAALFELGMTLVPWLILLYFHRNQSLPTQAVQRQQSSMKWKPLAILICTLPVLPYFKLLPQDGMRFWEQIQEPLWISMKLAFSVSLLTVFTVITGILTSKKLGKFISMILNLPSGISVLVLGLGFWIAFGRWIDPFEGSFLVMILLQSTLLVPFAFRSLWPLTAGTQWPLLEAASTLGASLWRSFWVVEWPRWRMPLVRTWALLTAASLGEVAAVSLFYSEKLVPLPLLMTRWMVQYRFEDAQSLAALLFILSGGITALVLSLE